MQTKIDILNDYYLRLYNIYGPQFWWPGETIDEIIIGAVLTQNTNWQNVEKAINNLKKSKILSLKKISVYPDNELSNLIRPSGYYNIKTKRLKSVSKFFAQYGNKNYNIFKNMDWEEFRKLLLGVYGVGQETADSILLYAFDIPTFVIDAYTIRIGKRHGFFDENVTYEKAKSFFEENLPRDSKIYNEFHALIVKTGKNFCKTKTLCESCPLKDTL